MMTVLVMLAQVVVGVAAGILLYAVAFWLMLWLDRRCR